MVTGLHVPEVDQGIAASIKDELELSLSSRAISQLKQRISYRRIRVLACPKK
jgi:hypothetical protein